MLEVTINNRVVKFRIETEIGVLRKANNKGNIYSGGLYQIKLLINTERELTEYECEVLARTEVLKNAIKREVQNETNKAH
ncbi:MAG: hypothetical protein LBC87_07375 [Fibromonadaceae bacterium]|jgi:hypothetical protein|nr:hypothetical protein [Fibromonadaceae bacterium]